jgi:hydrogenase maturation factor
MLGEADPEDIIRSGAAQPGDEVIMTKGVCIEGTALLAIERATEARYILGNERWLQARDFLHNPGISVVRDARIARDSVTVHAMHDPTEGGLCMGLYELARSAGLGIEVSEEQIPVLDLSFDLCTRFSMDPLRTLASGALLICVAPGDTSTLLAAYRDAGINAARIARLIEEPRYELFNRGLKYPLVLESGDDISKAVELDLWETK